MNNISIRINVSNNSRKSAALSLVEVAMSLSIFAVAVIPLMGLLAHGVKSNKVSLEETTLSSILERTTASLKSGESGPLFYNFYGERTSSTESVFKVEVLESNTSSGDVAFGLVSPKKYIVNITHLQSNKIQNGVIAPFLLKSRDPVTL